MALWDDVEPYNFVFVIRLRGRADVARLPAVPLVWVPTTLRGRPSLSVTYRESVFTRPEVGRLAEIFLAQLEALAEGGGPAAGHEAAS